MDTHHTLDEDQIAIPGEFRTVFKAQQAAYHEDLNPSLERRRADLRALRHLIADNADALVEAVSSDFDCRSGFEIHLSSWRAHAFVSTFRVPQREASK